MSPASSTIVDKMLDSRYSGMVGVTPRLFVGAVTRPRDWLHGVSSYTLPVWTPLRFLRRASRAHTATSRWRGRSPRAHERCSSISRPTSTATSSSSITWPTEPRSSTPRASMPRASRGSRYTRAVDDDERETHETRVERLLEAIAKDIRQTNRLLATIIVLDNPHLRRGPATSIIVTASKPIPKQGAT